MTAVDCSLTWAIPDDDGGAPIHNYIIEMKKPMDSKWSVVNANFNIDTNSHTVGKLTAGAEYVFRIIAENKAGKSEPSEPSDLAKYGKIFSFFSGAHQIFAAW